MVEHVAQAGFDPDARERAGGRLTGLNWQGRTIQSRDRLPPAVVHYIRHVVAQKEWPGGTTLEEYLGSITRTIISPSSRIFVSLFRNREWQLGIIAPSGDMRGGEEMTGS